MSSYVSKVISHTENVTLSAGGLQLHITDCRIAQSFGAFDGSQQSTKILICQKFNFILGLADLLCKPAMQSSNITSTKMFSQQSTKVLCYTVCEIIVYV